MLAFLFPFVLLHFLCLEIIGYATLGMTIFLASTLVLKRAILGSAATRGSKR